MARITVEDCLETIGENRRFDLVHLAVDRIRQHRHGEPFLVDGKNKEVVMTLREVAAGEVSFSNVETLPDAEDNKTADEPESEGAEGAETAA